MENKDRSELFYDVIDDACSLLYEIKKDNYFNLMFEVTKYILEEEVDESLGEENVYKFNDIFKRIYDVPFSVEDIRKAMQAQVLKALKETNNKNGSVTPDSLGLVMTYLISRLNNNKTIQILDPLIGSGNLLYTISNNLASEPILYGSDHDSLMIKVAKMIADLMNQKIDLIFADTFNLHLSNLDFIVFDSPNLSESEKYFPYDAILHYMNMLKNDGYIIGILPADFFNHDKDHGFKHALEEVGLVRGIIEFPDNFFVTNKKIMLVIQKNTVKKEPFMIKLPSFTDVNAFNQELLKLEMWLNDNKWKDSSFSVFK